ncbi:MAG: metallophosphoesterase family protein [Planctomycetaceae bacterium]
MRHLVRPFVVLLAVSALCRGDELTPSQAAFKPTPVPDRVLLGWKGDPATSQSVAWRTDDSVTKAVAQIAKSEPGPAFEKHARAVAATTQPLETNLGKACYHSVSFENLTPGTQYAYRVGDGETWSEWFQFRTASDKPAPLQFIYVGDAQNDLKSHWSRVIRQAYSDAPKARFVLHAGDLINRGDADWEWGGWFHSLGWIAGSVPQLAVPGNHEYSLLQRLKEGDGITPHWRPQFELPENGPMGLEETVWYADVQGVRIVGLNSNENYEIQSAWLEDVLGDNPNRWTIVTHHHPIHSASRNRDNPMLRRAWQPIYDKYGVDLVLQGHDHSYGRTGPLTFDPKEAQAAGDDQSRDRQGAVSASDDEINIPAGVRGRSPGGTVYVVSVSGPKLYELKQYPEGEDPFRRRAADTQLYQIITIDGDELKYQARTATCTTPSR